MFRIASTIEPLEKKVRTSGYCLCHCLPHSIHVLEAAHAMRLIERYLDRCRVGSGVDRIERGKIRDHANIGHDHLEILLVDTMANQVFQFGYILFSVFNASSGRNLQINRELASVGFWEERQAQHGIDGQAGQEHRCQSRYRQARPLQSSPNPVLIKVQDPVEPPVERRR